MFKKFIVLGVALLMAAGCSAHMAATGGGKRDLDVLSPGTPRDMVLAEIGTPVSSASDDGGSFDLFRFERKRSTASNTGRAILYGTAAVFTLGLSEVIATPLEGAVGSAGTMSLKTYYDDSNNLSRALVQDGGEWVTLEEYRRRASIQRSSNAPDE